MMLSDEKLYKLCKQYGQRARVWRRKFIGLLPEVFKRKLFEKKGFSSIFEFAAKLAGLSEEQVRRVLNLEKKFEDKPLLKSLLENGEVSVNKLAKIASIANTENQEILAGQVQILSTRTLETLVRDEKYITDSSETDGIFKHQGGLHEAQISGESVHVNAHPQGNYGAVNLVNDLKILEKFSAELKEKLHELLQKGINIDQLLLEFLKCRELEIALEKEQIASAIHENEIAGSSRRGKPAKPSRYIPVKIKKILQKEFGEKCSIQNCKKLSQETHHTQRFALGKNHDPRFLAPLCREHHQIAHSIDMRFHVRRLSGVLGQ